MKFTPIYYQERASNVSIASPPKEHGHLNIINPYGNTGLVSLWSKIPGKGGIWEKLSQYRPGLLEENSPLAVLSNLFGNGLPQMLANLAHNPQINRIAITGADLTGSAQALINYFSEGVEKREVGGIEMLVIKGTSFPIPTELHPNIFGSRKLEIAQFPLDRTPDLYSFLEKNPVSPVVAEGERVNVNLPSPKFKDFPSDPVGHSISAERPTHAWMEVLYSLDRFGKTISLGEKGKRRMLYNLAVRVKDASFEDESLLISLGFEPKRLREYQATMLDPSPSVGNSYTYGNRVGNYFGFDALEIAGKRIKKNPQDRHSLAVLWDPRADILAEGGDSSAPCFTDAYFVVNDDRLMLSANFRTHNAVSAWLTNLYGLRAMQEKVANIAKLEPGQLNVTSRWIGIDPENAKTNAALDIVKKNRKVPLDVTDPRGYFVATRHGEQLGLEHYSPEGLLLQTYVGNPRAIKTQLRQDRALSDPDHAMWVGYELARLEFERSGRVGDL